MALIRPFRAIRPQRDKVHLVATRPYYSYKKNVLKAKMEDNPYTFLHIINPEFNQKVSTKPNSKERFKLVKNRFESFLKSGVLMKEKQPTLYLYRQHKDKHVFTGVIGGASVAEYQNGLIKKHEATLTSREEMFTSYLEEVGFNAEPVLLTYEGNDSINSIISASTQERPEYEFTTTDHIKHEVWVLSQEHSTQLQKAFERIPCTYIADGHHRCASSASLAANRLNNGQDVLGAENFLAYFVEENNLSILAFNRLIRSLAGYSKATFLHALAALGNLQLLSEARTPLKEHEICIYLEKEWYSLLLVDYLIEEDHAVNSLDSQMLTEFILKPLLGIEDLKTSDQVEFVPGNQELSVISASVDSGKFAIGFVLYPLSIEQVKKVADQQMNMPPKSTYVEPKLRSGLTNYDINE
jgi:uncharacterized protein (DUF1015 family)